MRKIKLLVIALMAVVIGFSSCNSGVTEPQQIGHQVFKILKTFDTKSRQEFDKEFPTTQDFINLNDSEYFKDVKNLLPRTSESERNENISSCYNNIKTVGDENEIIWKDIKLSYFGYDVKYKDVEYDDNRLIYIEGELYFTHRGEEYKMETFSMWNGEEYMLMQIRESIY